VCATCWNELFAAARSSRGCSQPNYGDAHADKARARSLLFDSAKGGHSTRVRERSRQQDFFRAERERENLSNYSMSRSSITFSCRLFYQEVKKNNRDVCEKRDLNPFHLITLEPFQQIAIGSMNVKN